MKAGFLGAAWDGNLHEVLEYLKGRVMEMLGFRELHRMETCRKYWSTSVNLFIDKKDAVFCILIDRDLSDSVRIVCTSSVMVLHVLVVCML